MLPKKQRLNRTAFTHHFQLGKRRHTPHLTLIIAPSDSFKCAVVIGKKVAKKAHDRNRIRRRLYEIIRHSLGANNWPGVLIVVGKPVLSKLSKRQFATELTKEIALLGINQ
jgi:ribonuclease P protein component